MFSDDIQALASRLVKSCAGAGLTMVTAESCTGGLVAAAITGVAGASAAFDRGLITYSNQAKQDLLDVPAALLDAHGAVSEPVALAMAAGALARSGADLAIAVTGVAGPAGGTAQKPVGLVHFAAARAGRAPCHREVRFGAQARGAIQQAAVRVALEMLLEQID